MRRRQELARLAMAIATKEENVQRGTETNPTQLPAVPNPTGSAQSPNPERGRVSMEVREVLQETSNERI
jgi:hypothetical protein